jgi:hypothetical protein
MCAYQAPEVYVKEFVEHALRDVEGVQPYEETYKEMRIPHIRLQADYGVVNIVIETEPPCHRSRGREQVKDYMVKFNRPFGILIDIPVERYYKEYPNPCRDRVGFELYVRLDDRIDVVYVREFKVRGREKEVVSEALGEFRSLVYLLKKLPLLSPEGKVEPTPEYLITQVRRIIMSNLEELRRIVSASPTRARVYFNIWRSTMEHVYGREVIESTSGLDELFAMLTVYVTWLKCLGATLLEAALGGSRYTIPIKLYLDGYRAAVDLFWHRRALVRFNIDYLFERDEYDWVFDPEIAQRLDKLFRGIGESLLPVDWSREVELDLLKRIYQNVVPREVRRQLGEFYTPDWIAQIILWRALNLLVRRVTPREVITGDPTVEVVELIDEFYRRHGRIPRFIDPTCGSFTFGVHYINSLLRWYTVKRPPVNPVEFARQIMDSVVGIDLNPVAVITAKVNYLLQVYRLLALRGEFLVEQPVIPVLRIDLLSIHASSGERRRGGRATLDAYLIGRREDAVVLRIPLESLLPSLDRNLVDRLRSRGVSVISEGNVHYVEVQLPLTIMDRAGDLVKLARALIALLTVGVDGFENEVGMLTQDEREALAKFRNVVSALERESLNSVWHSLILNNLLALYATRRKFDLILGNLPWVNVSAYPSGYAEFVKSVARELGVSPPPRAARKLDISIPLFAVALNYLAGSPSVTALMIPTSIFRGLHGVKWRELVSSPPHTLVEVWDLEGVKPFEDADNQPGVVFVLKG